MPHAAPNKAETAPNAPDRTSPPSGGPRPETQPANSAPETGTSFRCPSVITSRSPVSGPGIADRRSAVPSPSTKAPRLKEAHRKKRPDGVGVEMIDTTAPLHHNGGMRLTINLEPDLYAVAVSLAKAEDCSISAAVNQLVRRSLPGAGPRRGEPAHGMERRNGLLVCYGKQVVTAETVQSIEEEDDAA